MSIASNTKTISFRINKNDKQKIKQAATINHTSITSYIISVVLKQANADIKNSENLVLHEYDSTLIMKLLDSTIEPNNHLTKLFE